MVPTAISIVQICALELNKLVPEVDQYLPEQLLVHDDNVSYNNANQAGQYSTQNLPQCHIITARESPGHSDNVQTS